MQLSHLKQVLKKALRDGNNVSLNALVQSCLLTYRPTPHWVTGTASCILMCGRKIKTRLDCLKDPISKEKSCSKNVRVRNIDLKEGDKVMVRDYSNSNKKEWKKVEEV